MSSVPSLSLSLLQQMTLITAGLKAGIPSEALFQTLAEHSEDVSPEEGALLRQIGEDLHALLEGRSSAATDPVPLLRELTHAVDHQMRNAHNGATANLQAGEMDLDALAPVLAALGDTQGLELLEQVRDRMKRAREGILRASGFLDAMAGLAAPLPAGDEPGRTLSIRIAELMNWKPAEAPKAPPASRPARKTSDGVPVLYVEDDPDAGEVVSLFLNTLDFVAAVHYSTTFEGALRVFSEHPTPILVTDYRLGGGGTGLDLSRELRRRKPELKTIITSGSIDELGTQMTEEEKRDILLIGKPFDMDCLLTGLAEAIDSLPPQ